MVNFLKLDYPHSVCILYSASCFRSHGTSNKVLDLKNKA